MPGPPTPTTPTTIELGHETARGSNASHYRPCCCGDPDDGGCDNPVVCPPCTDTGINNGDILIEFTNLPIEFDWWLGANSPWTLEQFGTVLGQFSCCTWVIEDIEEYVDFWGLNRITIQIQLDVRSEDTKVFATRIHQLIQDPFPPSYRSIHELRATKTDTYVCDILDHTLEDFAPGAFGVPPELYMTVTDFGGGRVIAPNGTEQIRFYQ